MRNDRTYLLPLAWNTQVGQWDLSPDYAAGSHAFDRVLTDRCVVCHSGNRATVAPYDDVFAEPLGAIGCENCHGPGSVHVEERRVREMASDSIDYTILNPAHLTLDRAQDVCQQCHLHGSVMVLRNGRSAFDFRPGELLADHHALFVDTEASEDGLTLVSHADRMAQSACFLETQGQPNALTCTTCHNPHGGFSKAESTSATPTCLSCHSSQSLQARFEAPDLQANHEPTADCASCHMPKVTASNNPHASFTDHKVRIVREGDTGPEPIRATQRLMPYFDRDAEGPEADVYSVLAELVLGIQTGDSAQMDAAIRVAKPILADTNGYGSTQFIMGRVLMERSRTDEAILHLEASVRLQPDEPAAVLLLAQAYVATGGEPSRIAALYDRALMLAPRDASLWEAVGRYHLAEGDLVAAEDAFAEALALDPQYADALEGQGQRLMQAGASAEATAAFDAALALDPNHAQALTNRGILTAENSQLAVAMPYFERAAKAAPDDPVILFNYGTLLLRLAEPGPSITYLRQALEQDPAFTNASTNLARAYAMLGEPDEARAVLERARTHAPDDPDLNALIQSLEQPITH